MYNEVNRDTCNNNAQLSASFFSEHPLVDAESSTLDGEFKSRTLHSCDKNTIMSVCARILNAHVYSTDVSEHLHKPETRNSAELHRKTLANGFWNGELEKELREKNMVGYIFSSVGDREKVMEQLNQQRAVSVSVYSHML